ncbi:MAG: prealbumin-like fold domain-containing protein, partial [Clostridium sp.]|nr:prealbumin-like fold domain-containing protein [Clostridium sp.]
TYTFRETKAPEGYGLNPQVFSFTVSGSDVLRGVYEVVNNELTVTIRKADGLTGALLAGAKIQITSVQHPEKTYEVTTGEDGTATFHPDYAGTYIVTEIEAPEGYEIVEASYEIIITEGGEVNGDTTIYNYEIDKPVKKVGKITAVYKKNRDGNGTYHFGVPTTVRTGDNTPVVQWIAGFILCMLGLAICFYIKCKNKKPPKKPGGGAGNGSAGKAVFGMLMILAVSAALPYTAIAADHIEVKTYTTQNPETYGPEGEFEKLIEHNGKKYRLESVTREIAGREAARTEGLTKIVISEPFLDDYMNHVPDKTILEDGITYTLERYKTIPQMLEERTMYVTDAIMYPAMEAIEKVPQTARITVTDDVTGQKKEAVLPLIDYSFSNARWKNGFEFEITVSDYDADYFMLGDKMVSIEEEYPLSGYERDLLKMVGLSESAYRIDRISWNGSEYLDQGILYRNLKASGQMLVSDCTARYGGDATLDAIDGQAIEAVYTYAQPALDADGTPIINYTMEAVAEYKQTRSIWDTLIDILSHPVTVALMLILLLIIICLFIISRKKREEKEDEELNKLLQEEDEEAEGE